jgi:3-hydroxyisobutyrate dehydrogenase
MLRTSVLPYNWFHARPGIGTVMVEHGHAAITSKGDRAMTTVAVLGLGAMGLRMATNLLAAGHQVVVYNRTEERARALEAAGATRARTPRHAAERCEIVISMVTDEDAARALWLDESAGAAGGLRPGAIAIESSTVTPAWANALAGAVAARDATFLDAPVVGSRPQAEAAALVFLVGGAAEALDRARGVLSAMGSAIHHVGPVGAGMIMKLAVNGLFGIQVAALAEILGMLEKSGIARAQAVEALGAMPVTSPALKGIAALMAARSFAPLFPIDLVDKDFRYILEAARRVGAATPASAAVREVYAQARRQGHGNYNIAGVVQVFD